MRDETRYGTHVNRRTAREYGTMDATTNGIYAYQHNVKCLDCGHTPGDVPDCPCCDTAAMTVTAPTHRNDDLDTAWDRYYDEHPDKDPSHAHVHTWLCRDCGMEREPLYGPDF